MNFSPIIIFHLDYFQRHCFYSGNSLWEGLRTSDCVCSTFIAVPICSWSFSLLYFHALVHSVYLAWNTLSCLPIWDTLLFTVLQLNGVYSERSSLTSAGQLRHSFLAMMHHVHFFFISLVTLYVLYFHICLSATTMPLKASHINTYLLLLCFSY